MKVALEQNTESKDHHISIYDNDNKLISGYWIREETNLDPHESFKMISELVRRLYK